MFLIKLEKCIFFILILSGLTVITWCEPQNRTTVGISEEWVCGVKTSCVECLRLTQCSWCNTEYKCFSKKLQDGNYCNENIIEYEDFSFSLLENAKCSCTDNSTEYLKENCRPEEDFDGPLCSGRGTCKCGRCICDNPDPDDVETTKVILGDFCELDNFSCDGPHCGEGPYSLHQQEANRYASEPTEDEVDQPNEP